MKRRYPLSHIVARSISSFTGPVQQLQTCPSCSRCRDAGSRSACSGSPALSGDAHHFSRGDGNRSLRGIVRLLFVVPALTLVSPPTRSPLPASPFLLIPATFSGAFDVDLWSARNDQLFAMQHTVADMYVCTFSAVLSSTCAFRFV